MRYVALLRGVNVGGNTMIKMEELRRTLEAAGLKNVASYINTGNLAFDSGRSTEEKTASKIEAAIRSDFGKEIPAMVRRQPAIHEVLGNNPFKGEFENHKEMHVLFMKDEMPADKAEQLLAQQTPEERFAIRGREIYCHLRLGVANSLLGKGYIEKKLKIPITARNWRTVQVIAEL